MDRAALREKILATNTLPREPLEIPEWGCTVWAYALTGAQRDSIEAHVMKNRNDLSHLRARIVVYSARSEDGERLFTDEDIPALEEQAGSALERIFQCSQRLSCLESSDIEELKKN